MSIFHNFDPVSKFKEHIREETIEQLARTGQAYIESVGTLRFNFDTRSFGFSPTDDFANEVKEKHESYLARHSS